MVLLSSDVESWSNPLTVLGQSFKYLVIFLIILYLAYVFAKWVAVSGLGKKNSSNIKILESVTVGGQNVLQLVQVGEKYLVIGVSKEKITYLTEINEESINVPTAPEAVEMPFEKYLDIFQKKKKHNVKNEE